MAKRKFIERDLEILSKKENGISYKDLSKEYGLSTHRIQQIVYREREKVKIRENNPTDDFLFLECDYPSVYYALRRANIHNLKDLRDYVKANEEGRKKAPRNFGVYGAELLSKIFGEELVIYKCRLVTKKFSLKE